MVCKLMLTVLFVGLMPALSTGWKIRPVRLQHDDRTVNDEMADTAH